MVDIRVTYTLITDILPCLNSSHGTATHAASNALWVLTPFSRKQQTIFSILCYSSSSVGLCNTSAAHALQWAVGAHDPITSCTLSDYFWQVLKTSEREQPTQCEVLEILWPCHPAITIWSVPKSLKSWCLPVFPASSTSTSRPKCSCRLIYPTYWWVELQWDNQCYSLL